MKISPKIFDITHQNTEIKEIKKKKRELTQGNKKRKKGKKVMEVQRQIFTGVCRITET
jgi:hypothetical protein